MRECKVTMLKSNDFVRLEAAEILAGDRPFTNPDHNADDTAKLQYMANRLRHLLSQLKILPDQPRPYILYLEEPNSHQHRIVIANLKKLLIPRKLAIVGFYGQKRPDVDQTLLNLVDAELVDEFHRHPHLLSYSSLELESGDWYNLVLFSHPQAISHWSTGVRHTYAAREIAPDYYLNIRLHNGFIPSGLMSGNLLTLTCTKYYDFQE